jgi:tetratricopeptide (TPR) repeat protein
MRTFAGKLAVAFCLGAFAASAATAAQQPNREWQVCHDNAGDSDARIAACTEVLNRGALDGKHRAHAFNDRAVAFARKGQYDRAIQDYDEAIRLAPQTADLLGNRGWSYIQKGDYDRALADLNEAIRLNPRVAMAFDKRGRAYFRKGEYDRAIADFDEAIRLDPKMSMAFSNRGVAFIYRGQFDRAIQDFDEAIRHDPKNARGYVLRGRTYEQRGDRDRAIQDFKSALSLRGNGVTADSEVDTAKERLAVLDRVPQTPVVTAPSPVVTAPPSPQVAVALPPAVFGRRVALVIGNSEYRHAPKLNNPTNDETDLARVLSQLGFDVVARSNLNRHAMDDAIREFGRKLEGADLALFFYSGHGLQVGGKNYLVPIDAKLERAGDLALDTVEVSTVMAQMETEKRVNLVFLDACRDNPLARSLAGAPGARALTVRTGLASVQSAIGTMIVYATQPDNVAFDGMGQRNSPFTTALLKHIATPNVEISAIMRRVRADVIAATREQQVPWDHSSLIGEVILAR